MFNRKLAASMLALTLVGGTALQTGNAFAGPPDAAPPGPQNTSSEINAAAADALKVSREGYFAMRRASGAEMALAKGDLAAAAKLVGEARASLRGAAGDAVPLRADGAVHVLPIAVQFGLSEDFTTDPTNKEKLAEASAQLRSGNPSAAGQTLKQAGADYQTIVAMIPLEPTQQWLGQAAQRINADDAEGALSALKTIRDHVAVASLDLAVATPTPQTASAASPGEEVPLGATAQPSPPVGAAETNAPALGAATLAPTPTQPAPSPATGQAG